MRRKIKYRILLATLAIIAVGLMAIYSASSYNSRVNREVFYDQLLCVGVSVVILFFLSNFNYRRFYDMSYALYALNIILLFLVLFIGRHILGARRWIEVGHWNFQPSELTKLVVILTLSRYFCDHGPTLSYRGRNLRESLWPDLLFPLFLTLIPMLLVFKQPDLGTSILIFCIFIAMVFAAGVRGNLLASFLTVCLAAAPFLWHILKPYQKQRLMVFLNPNADPLGAGYTIIQSKISVGSGMIFGKGWMSGTQNQLNFLPERHTDFIFSVVGEEWGFLGAIFLLACFFVLIDCAIKIAQHTHDRFGFLVASGIVSILALQVIINVGMVLGLFPVVGITLPLVSYGRSSFVIFIVMIGLLLNLNKQEAGA